MNFNTRSNSTSFIGTVNRNPISKKKKYRSMNYEISS